MDQQIFKFKTFILLLAVTSFAWSPMAQAESPVRVYQGYSTAAGDQALHSLTNGVWNTAIGSWALLSDTSGACNAAVVFKRSAITRPSARTPHWVIWPE